MRPHPAVLLKSALPVAIAAVLCTAGTVAASTPRAGTETPRRAARPPARQRCQAAAGRARRAAKHCKRKRVVWPDLNAVKAAAEPPTEPPAAGSIPPAGEPSVPSPADAEASPPAEQLEVPPPAEELDAPSGEEPASESEASEAAQEGSGEPSHFRFFSSTSFWNSPLAADAPLDPESTAMVNALDSLVSSELLARTGPSINTTESSVPVYTVPAEQPTVSVELASGFAATALRSAWSAVPLPPDAQPARGNDRHLVVWQPSTDRLWEFWEMSHDDAGWQAGWGGAMLHASSDPGVYDADAWPGATRFWGASASSLSIAGGLITFEDLEHGSIEHALSMSIPNVRAGVYSSPAQRGDGKSPDPLSLPEGAHLRIDPTLDLNSLHLPPVTLMLARAAQRYGIIVRDGARTVTFQAQDPTPTGSDPYRGPDGFWEGSYPRAILAGFPWDHLQLVQMDLHPNPAS
jgi:hypothetical protein